MARGKPLTPLQISQAAATYAATGSYADAGRAIGVDESVARRALIRAMGEGGESERVALHARAVERGLRKGRRAFVKAIDKLDKKVEKSSKTSEIVSATKGLSLSVARLQALAELELQRRREPLLRRKLRAEAKAAEKDAPTVEQIVAMLASLPKEDLVALRDRLRGTTPPGALPAPDPSS